VGPGRQSGSLGVGGLLEALMFSIRQVGCQRLGLEEPPPNH